MTPAKKRLSPKAAQEQLQVQMTYVEPILTQDLLALPLAGFMKAVNAHLVSKNIPPLGYERLRHIRMDGREKFKLPYDGNLNKKARTDQRIRQLMNIAVDYHREFGRMPSRHTMKHLFMARYKIQPFSYTIDKAFEIALKETNQLRTPQPAKVTTPLKTKFKNGHNSLTEEACQAAEKLLSWANESGVIELHLTRDPQNGRLTIRTKEVETKDGVYKL